MLDMSGYVSGIVDGESLAQRKYLEREFLSTLGTHVHLNRFVVRHDLTCKRAVSPFAILTFFFLLTVSHFLRDSVVDRAFYVFRYCTGPVKTFISPSHKLRLRAKSSPVSQSTLVYHYYDFLH
jgi:hypothetical protein